MVTGLVIALAIVNVSSDLLKAALSRERVETALVVARKYVPVLHTPGPRHAVGNESGNGVIGAGMTHRA